MSPPATAQATKQAFVLLRVSSSGQTRRAGAEEGYSIEMQREACLRKAEGLGANVVKEWVAPAESASRGFYKTLRDMIEALKLRDDVDYVIVYKLDRFSRDELTNFAAHAQIKEAGAELVSATENIDDSPQGMLLHTVLTGINAYYSRDLALKITDGRVTKAKMGGTPGKVPLGYLNKRKWDGPNDIRYVEIDEERAPLVAWAFAAYSTGDWSIKSLEKELYRRGLRTRPTPKRPARKVSTTVLWEMLKNPYYVGVVEFRGVKYEGTHPRFISQELFDKVQEVLTSQKMAGDRTRKKHSHYLVGSVYCGQCGKRLMFTRCTGRNGKFDYLVCPGRHKDKSCDLPYQPVDRVEDFVVRYYETRITVNAERVAALVPNLIEEYRRVARARNSGVELLRKKVDDLRAKKERLVESHLANPVAIPLDVLEVKQVKLGDELKAAESQLASASGDSESAENGIRRGSVLLSAMPRSYRKATPLFRRQMNQAYFLKVFIGRKGVTGAILTPEFEAITRDDLNSGRGSTADLLGAIYAAGYSPSAWISHGKRLCAARDSPPTEPDVRGYAAIVGVFRQKRGFLPDQAPLGSSPRQSFDFHQGRSESSCAAWRPMPRQRARAIRCGDQFRSG
jgi:site-specific DNA recombinase